MLIIVLLLLVLLAVKSRRALQASKKMSIAETMPQIKLFRPSNPPSFKPGLEGARLPDGVFRGPERIICLHAIEFKSQIVLRCYELQSL